MGRLSDASHSSVFKMNPIPSCLGMRRMPRSSARGYYTYTHDAPRRWTDYTLEARSSAQILRKRHRIWYSLRYCLSSKTRFADEHIVFIDAPHVLSPVDLAEAFRSSSETSTLDDLGAQEATADSDPALLPRGWWNVDATRTKTTGLEDSILQLRDILQKDRYDGIFGFR